jgi:hypothetical protein
MLTQKYFLVELVNKRLYTYFIKTYKKLRFDDFIGTNDYEIQRVTFFIQELKKMNNVDVFKYGQILQNFILSIEKPIMLASEYKLVRSAISK